MITLKNAARWASQCAKTLYTQLHKFIALGSLNQTGAVTYRAVSKELETVRDEQVSYREKSDTEDDSK